MIKAFIFDIGNVLLRFDFTPAVNHLAGHSAIDPSVGLAEVERLKLPYERGDTDTPTFLRQVRDLLGYDGSEADLIRCYQEIFWANEPMHRLVEALAPHYPLYLLSNTSQLHLDYVEATFPVFRHFRDGVYSHLAGCAKPEPLIYEKAITGFDVDPATTLFIDDLLPNIEAARAAGLQAIHYDALDHPALLRELRQRLPAGIVPG